MITFPPLYLWPHHQTLYWLHPKVAKVCSLNLAEMTTCKDFIEEHLWTGQIVSLKSLQASSFFFVPNKDRRAYAHVRIIVTWTLTLSGTPILFPLSQNSLMTWRSLPYSLSSTFVGNTITSPFKKKISGKLHLSPPRDYLNLQSCSLDSVMLPPHSKLSWTY